MAAEGGAGGLPHVFVVDRQASYVAMPDGKRAKWAAASHTCLLLLVGVALLGLVVEACFIYNLYKQIENLSGPKASQQQGEAQTSPVKFTESNEIPTVLPQPDKFQRPFAQLIGPTPSAERNPVVQWIHEGGDAVLNGMGYHNGSLLVESDGHYYLYSKLTFSEEECVLIQHRVMKVTQAYGHNIELMKSKSHRCATNQRERRQGGQDLWNSFLAGIFYLHAGDRIFVPLDDISKMRMGTSDRIGAFMISP
ncbi:tumor necrosis factor ligand superfamily member 14 [Nelusetta ayraudi]|uniref:tumor necrosis factor ligand superfamily member 14 n=1 Tax=Nelusetta ayraudi TaxID=303726 RepID=UPI003F70CD05